MRSLTFVAPGELRIDDVAEPELVDPGDALVRTLACTTCDLDHEVIGGRTPFSNGPFALGHECVGTVVAVGDDCAGVAVGDVVAVPWHIACGVCEQCAVGHPARCRRHWNAQYGLPVNGDWGGTFAEIVRVPYAAYNLVRIPDGIDPLHLASLGDNLALGWELVMPSLEGIDDPEVVILGGTQSIGLYCADVAVNVAGARTVYVDDDPHRLDIARRLGAETRDRIPSRRGVGEFHLAVDASADPARLRVALLSVRPEGQVNSAGIYFDDVALPLLELYLRGVNFHNGKGHARANMEQMLDAFAAGRIRPELVTSGVYDFQEAPTVLIEHPGRKPIFTFAPG